MLRPALPRLSALCWLATAAQGAFSAPRSATGASDRGRHSATGVVPLVEYVLTEGFADVVYGDVQNLTGGGFRATHVLGGAYPAAAAPSPGTGPLYRCVGKHSAQLEWQFSFYSTEASCAGHPFTELVGRSVAAYVHTAPGPALRPIYRYTLGENLNVSCSSAPDRLCTSVLSAVPPDPALLEVMRYRTDTASAGAPVFWVVELDAALDTNERWLAKHLQHVCFRPAELVTAGAATATEAYRADTHVDIDGDTQRLTKGRLDRRRYRPACPIPAGWSGGEWSLLSLDSPSAVWAAPAPSGVAPRLSMPPRTMASLLGSKAIRGNAPLLLTLRADGGALLAAKLVRIVRTPFISQVELNVEDSRSFGGIDLFTNSASSLLLQNMLTAHTAFTDPLSLRPYDPALWDGVIWRMYRAPYEWFGSGHPPPDEQLRVLMRDGFERADERGVLLVAEAPYALPYLGTAVSWCSDVDFFDWEARVNDCDPVAAAELAGLMAVSLNVTSGRFYNRTVPGTNFYFDYSNPSVEQAFATGAARYMSLLAEGNVSLAGVSLSENLLQWNYAKGSLGTDNNNRLPYYESPTFSAHSHRSFSAYLRRVGAPAVMDGLPALPADYAKVLAAGEPAVARLQSAAPEDPLWRHWARWRREVLSGILTTIARSLKAAHRSAGFYRSELVVLMYNYCSWYAIGGEKYDVIDDDWWVDGYKFMQEGYPDPTIKTVFADQGSDFLTAHQIDPTEAFDYYVAEIKGTADNRTSQLLDKFSGMRPMAAERNLPPPQLGLHVEVEGPVPSSNFMNVHLERFWPTAGSFTDGTAAYDMVFAWEALCEYVLSMKPPDALDSSLNVTWLPSGAGLQVNDWGNYSELFGRFNTSIGRYCLLRHADYNLVGRSQAVLRENLRRLLVWKAAYLRAQ